MCVGSEVQAGQGVGFVYGEGVDTAVIGRSTSVQHVRQRLFVGSCVVGESAFRGRKECDGYAEVCLSDWIWILDNVLTWVGVCCIVISASYTI